MVGVFVMLGEKIDKQGLTDQRFVGGGAIYLLCWRPLHGTDRYVDARYLCVA